MQKLYEGFKKHTNVIAIALAICFIVLFILPFILTNRVRINKEYWNKEDVALYIKTYNTLPSNYITHYGYEYANRHSISLEGKIVGGDTHWSDSALDEYGVSRNSTLKECDIWSDSYDITSDRSNRGALRLVYTTNTKNPRVFYTTNHYTSYTEISNFSLQLGRNIAWIIFGVYTLSGIVYLGLMYSCSKKYIEVVED